MNTQLNNYVYCTLQEVYQDLGFDADNLNSCINSAAEKFANTLCEIAAIDNSEYLTYLFKYYVTPRCWKSVVDITEDTDTAHEELLGTIACWCRSTNTRYSTLLKYYEDQQTDLLRGISTTSTSTNRTSDTPEVDGIWDGDDQLSSIATSTTTSTTDSASVIEQLDLLKRKWNDLYEGWADLFRAKFTQEVPSD